MTVDASGRATKLVGDKRHPFTRGGLCAKVNAYLDDRVHNPDRLLFPLRRTGAKGAICGDNGQAGVAATLGVDSGFDPEDLEHSRLVLLWGTNPS